MHDAGLVRGRQPGGDAARDDHHARHRQLAFALEDGREVLALDKRHRDVLEAVDLADVVDADDVLVGDLAGEQQLLLEPLLEHPRRARVGGHFGADHLERHRHAQLFVPRLVDGAHAAGAEQLDDVIAVAEVLADEIGRHLAEAAVGLAAAGRPGPRHDATGRARRRRDPGVRLVGIGRTGRGQARHARILETSRAGAGGRTSGRHPGHTGIVDVGAPTGGRVRTGRWHPGHIRIDERGLEADVGRRIVRRQAEAGLILGERSPVGSSAGIGVATPIAVTARGGRGIPQDRQTPEPGSVALPHLGQVIGGSNPGPRTAGLAREPRY